MSSPWDPIERIEGMQSVVGPASINVVLADAVASVPYEGIWVPWLYSKFGSVEVYGSMSTLSCQLYSTNRIDPLNSYVVTVGGTLTVGDTLTVGATTPSGVLVATYTTVAGDTTTTMAAGLAAYINQSIAFASLGFTATNNAAVLTVNWPSIAPPSGMIPYTTSNPAVAQTVTLTTSVSGSATETMTVTCGVDGSTVGSAMTTLGNVVSLPTVRWLKLRVTTLTGSGAVIDAIAQGAA